jgi:hypothetical protein
LIFALKHKNLEALFIFLGFSATRRHHHYVGVDNHKKHEAPPFLASVCFVEHPKEPLAPEKYRSKLFQGPWLLVVDDGTFFPQLWLLLHLSRPGHLPSLEIGRSIVR